MHFSLDFSDFMDRIGNVPINDNNIYNSRKNYRRIIDIMRLSINEILMKANEIEDADKRREFLYQNDSVALRTILKYCYDPAIEWLLPKGPAPYKPSVFPDSHGMLYNESRKLYIFVRGGNDNLTKVRREQLFINLLESIDKDDAELLVSIKDRKLPYKLLTKKFIEKAFPGLI